jgi:hypothetical protein
MASENRQCRILLFKCVFNDPALDLQKLIALALSKKKDGIAASSSWKARRYFLTGEDDDGECLLINHLRGISRVDTNNIFGDLCRYRPGGKLAAITEVDNAAELDVDLLAPGEKKQFLNGTLYWRVAGNYILILQSATVRYRALVNYLNWLLMETKVLPAEAFFELQQDISIKKNNPTVKSLVLGGTVPSPAAAFRHSREDAATSAKERFGGSFLAALRNAIGDDTKLQKLLNKIPEGQDVSIEISISLPPARKIADPIRLSDITAAVDALEDAAVTAETENGRVEVGRLLQRPDFKKLVANHDGIWDRQELYLAFGEAWRNFSERGLIT